MMHLLLSTMLATLFQISQVTAELPAPRILQDFSEKPFGFLYDSWAGQSEMTTSGIDIGGSATAKGGGGTHFSMDLSSYHGLAIRLEVLPGNDAESFNIILKSEGGKASGYSFKLPMDTDKPVTMVVDMKKPFFIPDTEAGGPVDLRTITQFQIQGNYKDQSAVAIRFHLLEAIPAKP